MQGLEIGSEGGAEVLAAERELYGGFEETELVAGIVAGAFERLAVDGPLAEQRAQSVGELYLAAGAGRGGAEGIENFRLQDVGPYDGEVRWRLVGRRLLNHILQLIHSVRLAINTQRLAADHAVA